MEETEGTETVSEKRQGECSRFEWEYDSSLPEQATVPARHTEKWCSYQGKEQLRWHIYK